MLWILDLDGVVWRGDAAIDGAPEAVRRLRRDGHRLLFVTNNSSARISDYLAKLASFGLDASPDELVSSAQAAATLIEPGTRVLVCAGPGVDEAISARGAVPIREGPADSVVVGWHRDFDYERLTAAFRAVEAGARLIGTNDDPTYPTGDGLIPGGGSILASIVVASGKAAEIAGKPNPPMAALIRSRVGDALLADAVLVGDRPSTDGAMAHRLELPFVLVLSGVTTTADQPVEPEPALVASDLADAVTAVCTPTDRWTGPSAARRTHRRDE